MTNAAEMKKMELVNLCEETRAWYYSLVDKSSTVKKFYRNFFKEVEGYVNGSIERWAMAYSFFQRLDSDHWNRMTHDNDDILSSFPAILKDLQHNPYAVKFVFEVFNDLEGWDVDVYYVNPKTCRRKFAYHMEYDNPEEGYYD